jgi:hypothetical protein
LAGRRTSDGLCCAALVKSRERVAQVRVNVIKRLNDLYIEAQSTGSTSALDSKLDSYEEVTASS